MTAKSSEHVEEEDLFSLGSEMMEDYKHEQSERAKLKVDLAWAELNASELLAELELEHAKFEKERSRCNTILMPLSKRVTDCAPLLKRHNLLRKDSSGNGRISYPPGENNSIITTRIDCKSKYHWYILTNQSAIGCIS
jgi:hypothetical protein